MQSSLPQRPDDSAQLRHMANAAIQAYLIACFKAAAADEPLPVRYLASFGGDLVDVSRPLVQRIAKSWRSVARPGVPDLSTDDAQARLCVALLDHTETRYACMLRARPIEVNGQDWLGVDVNVFERPGTTNRKRLWRPREVRVVDGASLGNRPMSQRTAKQLFGESLTHVLGATESSRGNVDAWLADRLREVVAEIAANHGTGTRLRTKLIARQQLQLAVMDKGIPFTPELLLLYDGIAYNLGPLLEDAWVTESARWRRPAPSEKAQHVFLRTALEFVDAMSLTRPPEALAFVMPVLDGRAAWHTATPDPEKAALIAIGHDAQGSVIHSTVFSKAFTGNRRVIIPAPLLDHFGRRRTPETLGNPACDVEEAVEFASFRLEDLKGLYTSRTEDGLLVVDPLNIPYAIH